MAGESVDYASLGRYIANKEKAEEMSARRNSLLSELRRLISICLDAQSVGGFLAGTWDIPRAGKLIAEAERCDESMGLAIAEANACAKEAGRPELRLRTGS